MKDTYGMIKLFFKFFWLSVMLVAFYFLFFHKFEDYRSEIPEKYIRPGETAESFDLMAFTFYYSDGLRLIPEDRKIRIEDNPLALAGRVLNEYMKGPENTDLFMTLPEKTLVRNFFLLDNVLYIDFSREIQSNYLGGIIPELHAIYGIVNTVCQVGAVESVKFLINGEDTSKLISHLFTGEPVSPDNNLIHRF
ncbi:MAG: GerMN domain-containing protein [Candidatus Muiribacteriota bacterium]